MKTTLLLSLLMTAGEWDLNPADPWDVQPEPQAVAWSVAPSVQAVGFQGFGQANRPEKLLDATFPNGWSRVYPLGEGPDKPLAIDAAAHTPMAEVVRVIQLLPKPQIAFVDFGCGYDARWCVAAAEHWGCKAIGVEIDPNRAAAARERVRNLGLDHLITIIEGDAGEVDIAGDVAVAYLYPELLARLKPRLEYFRAVASYLHEPPGLASTKNGDTWFYTRPQQQQVQQAHRTQAVWNGVAYSSPVCNNPNCAMCNSIRGQLAKPISQTVQPQKTQRRWACVNGRCGWYDFPI